MLQKEPSLAKKLFIIGPAHPLRGGIADTNESLARALQRIGHDVSIISFKKQYPNLLFPGKTQYSKDPAPENITIHHLIHSYNPFNWLKVARFINQKNPDLVIVRYWMPFFEWCLDLYKLFSLQDYHFRQHNQFLHPLPRN